MTWQQYLEANQERFTGELLDFLAIPSVSAIAAHAPDVQRAAEWVAARLERIGMHNVAIMPTGGHPVVYADWLGAPDQPTILIYGHFDTQPADPVELWESPPFAPVIKDDRVYARGASDDKGNMLAPIIALEALLAATGALPVNVKCFFEGQEEIGSPQIPPFVAANRERFACDIAISADGGQWSETEAEIGVTLRGGCGLQIDVVGPKMDLHSGMYGGMVHNPIHALVGILDSLRDATGHILVGGFYDGVAEITPDARRTIADVPFDAEDIMERVGVDALFGEPEFTPRERNWARPTLEINGIWGGFQGDGVKTVLPSAAHAKITCRLVGQQDGKAIVAAISQHVAEHTPPGVTVTCTPLGFSAKPYTMPKDAPGVAEATAVLAEYYQHPPYFTGSGGSIPVCTMFKEVLGAYTVIFGFGLPDEQVHSPNEFFRLASFRRGQEAYVKLLSRLATDK